MLVGRCIDCGEIVVSHIPGKEKSVHMSRENAIEFAAVCSKGRGLSAQRLSKDLLDLLVDAHRRGDA